ncbi:hypothetical protein DFS34DRAFT_593980 [Phlyctochytrium arcticum]|nr:hypothetical protein DFS34DRAFT_593980 [Phlyctochytrium arcticum]
MFSQQVPQTLLSTVSPVCRALSMELSSQREDMLAPVLCTLQHDPLLKTCPALCGEECPETAYCQLCASAEILNQQVDMILFETYGNIDVNEDPIIVLPCKHIFTMSTLDGHLRLSSCYELDEQGNPLRAKPFTVDPDSQASITGCPSCRGSLRSINRYKRRINKAVLDEATQKFISWAHTEHTALCEAVQTFETKLNLDVESNQTTVDEVIWAATTHPEVVDLRRRLEGHQEMCTEAEQPYGKTRSLIVDAARRRNIPESFHLYDTDIQTTCSLRAQSLTLQLHQVRVTALREMLLKTTATLMRVTQIRQELADLAGKYAKQSRELVDAAEEARSHALETEARLFWAFFECKNQYVGTLGKYKVRAEKLLREVTSNLNGSKLFYTKVTDEERQAVYHAMKVEFRGSGHWYRCENGHPDSSITLLLELLGTWVWRLHSKTGASKPGDNNNGWNLSYHLSRGGARGCARDGRFIIGPRES